LPRLERLVHPLGVCCPVVLGHHAGLFKLSPHLDRPAIAVVAKRLRRETNRKDFQHAPVAFAYLLWYRLEYYFEQAYLAGVLRSEVQFLLAGRERQLTEVNNRVVL